MGRTLNFLKNRLVFLGFLGVCLSLLVCSNSSGIGFSGKKSKLTADNFLKIQAGMNHQEVRLILGNPTEEKGSYELGIRSMEWREGNKYVSVSIDNNGNVMTFTQGGSAAKIQRGLD